MQNNNKAESLFATPQQIDIGQFAELCAQSTNPAEYPLALDCRKNVLIYCGDQLRNAVADSSPEQKQAYRNEIAKALKDGPGVVVIKNAFATAAPIDQMNQVFEQIFAHEAETGIAADHFANAGANGRIWNVFEKSALQSPEAFTDYYRNPLLQLVAESWLGPHYQISAQVNVVRPGGEAQQAHRDYHLGFQENDEVSRYPLHIQQSSCYLTLQGAVAHSDMPLETGPTLLLPFSQQYPLGYLAWRDIAFKEYFQQHAVQLPLTKGDAVFFSPALFHAAGCNITTDQHRSANLMQISSAFAKPMESINSYRISDAIYSRLATTWPHLDNAEREAIISAACDGYSFPSNLDCDPPLNGMAPQTHAQLTAQALNEQWDSTRYRHESEQHRLRRLS